MQAAWFVFVFGHKASTLVIPEVENRNLFFWTDLGYILDEAYIIPSLSPYILYV